MNLFLIYKFNYQIQHQIIPVLNFLQQIALQIKLLLIFSHFESYIYHLFLEESVL